VRECETEGEENVDGGVRESKSENENERERESVKERERHGGNARDKRET